MAEKEENIKIDKKLSDKLSSLLFNDKQTRTLKDVFKNLNDEFIINNIEDINFLSLQEQIEALCILKDVNYENEFKLNGLIALLDKNADEKFSQPLIANITNAKDINLAHKLILEKLKEICSTFNVDNELGFEVQFEKSKTEYKYNIVKERKIWFVFDKIRFDEKENKIFLMSFGAPILDLTKNMPPELKVVRTLRVSKRSPIPTMRGFYLEDIEEVLTICKKYIENEKLA